MNGESKKAGKFKKLCCVPKFKKYCCVPSCGWTEDSGKHLVAFPFGGKRTEERQRWIEAVNIYATAGQRLSCCEDHFVLSEDAENFIKVKLMGGRLMMKPGVVPHKNLGLGNETGGVDTADPVMQHFLLGRSVPVRSQLKNFDVVIQGDGRSPVSERSQLENFDVVIQGDGRSPVSERSHPENVDEETQDDKIAAIPPCSVCSEKEMPRANSPNPKESRKKSRPPRTRTHDQYSYKIAALKRKMGEYVVSKPGVLKRSRPRILRSGKKPLKKLPEPARLVLSHDVVCVKDENEVLLIEDNSNSIPEPENIVVDVDLLANTCPCPCVEGNAHSDVDPLADGDDPVDPQPAGDPFGYHFLASDPKGNEVVEQPTVRPSANWTPPIDPTLNKDGIMHTYGTDNENGDVAPLVVIEKKPPEYDDVNELSEEENCEMPSSSEDEFPAEKSDEEESDGEDCSAYLVRDIIRDMEDIDRELHECIRNIETNPHKLPAGCKRKSNDETIDRSSKTKKKKTELKNGEGCNDSHRLVVNIDTKTLVGKSKDGGDFIWHTLPRGTITPESYYPPKPVGCVKNVENPLDCFLLFFTEEMMELLIHPTNKKIAEYRQKQCSKSRTYADVESTLEMKALVGLLVYAAAKKDSHLPLSVMFHVGSNGARYRSIMSSQRLKLLLQCLQCGRKSSEPESRDRSADYDLWETFLDNCRSNYQPGQNVTVGDQIVRFTRKCPFRLSRRRGKYGLRHTLVVDSSTKYVVDAIPNGGARLTSENLQKLTESLKSSNRNVTFENPVGISLISELRHNGLTAVGILDQDDMELPREMTSPDFEDREIRSSLFIHREEMTAVSYKTRSTEVVCYVSSMHSEPELNNKKPEVIVSYNSNKDAVRTFNNMVDSVNCARRTKRWTLRIFFNMLSIACANAYVVYLHNVYRRLVNSDEDVSDDNCQEKPLGRLDFLVKLADKLTSKWVRKRLTDYRSLYADLLEQARQSLPALAGNQIDRTPPEIARDAQKCAHCPDETRAGRKTCIPCGHCKKPVCRDHLSKFCTKCLIKI